MKFKEWFLAEAGHLRIQGPAKSGVSFIALFKGKPTLFRSILWIDPQFERQSVPPPPNYRAPKFLGDRTFSLPLVDRRGSIAAFIVSQRENMVNGTGTIRKQPEGLEVPNNWADHAIIIRADGLQTHGANIERLQKVVQFTR